MKNKKYLSLICIIAINLYSSNDIINLEQVSVIATKKDTLNLKQNLSISQKDKDEIELDQVIYQKDLLNSLAGVRIEQTSSIIGHMTAIRMPKNTSSYYLFMQDGIPVQSSGFFNHNALAYTTFETASGVEVLKGAGTALYGSDAVAATIDVKSLNVEGQDSKNSVKVRTGSDGYLSTGFDYGSIISDTDKYRTSFNYSKSDGWREHTAYDRYEFNFRYDKELDLENIINITFNASKTDAEQADSFSDISYIENGSTKASDDPNFYTALSKTDVRRKFDYARLSMDWTNYKYKDLEMVFTPYIRYNRNRYVATWETNLPSNDNKIDTLGFMQRNTLKTKYGRVIFGLDSEYTKSSLNYNQDFNLTVSGWGGATYTKGPIYDYDVVYTALAPYISNKWNINKNLDMTLGARYDYNHFDYTNNLSTGTDSSGVYYRPASRTDTFNHFSPKFSLGYSIDQDSNIYFRYANGFRIPSATRLYSMKTGYKEVTLNPETSDTYEIGYKKLFLNKGFFETSIYYMTIDDTITRKKVTGSDDYYYNGGETIHRGIEVTLFNKLTDEFSSKIAYSYSKHNFHDDENYHDNEMEEAPKNTGNFRLFYNPNSLKRLLVMGEMQYVGSYWMDNDNTKKYEGYKIYNLKATYKHNKKLTILAKVTNLTDKKYATMASSGWGDSYTPGDPRQYFLGLEYKY